MRATWKRASFAPAWVSISLAVILGIAAAIRLRLLNCPLERDEGEFAYAAQLLGQGLSPYDWAYPVMLKLPGTFMMYALSMALFGQTAVGIHFGLLLVNLATSVMVFVLARRITGNGGGIVAAGTFALLSIVPATLGLAAHATHFVLLPALAGILLIQKLDERVSQARVFGAGLLLGLAFWMKQPGALFGLFAAGWILRCEFFSPQKRWSRAIKRLGCLAAGGLAPILLTCLVVAWAGDFHRFWFWAFGYASAHATIFTWQGGLMAMLVSLSAQFTAAPALWSLAIAGLILIFGQACWRPWRFFIASFAFFSFLAVCPGWYFRGHYFILLLPVAGLLAGVTFRAVSDLLQDARFSPRLAKVPILVFAFAMVSSLLQWNEIFFRATPNQACRAIYGTNPFPEAREIARYFESHCAPDARIAVLGSEPEIFFYSHRRSATGHVDTYPLVENQPYAGEMRAEMIREIEKAAPEYVVYVNVPGSWVQTTAKMNQELFDWFDQYRQSQLSLIGLVEIQPDQTSRYTWFDQPPAEVKTDSEFWLAIFKKR